MATGVPNALAVLSMLTALPLRLVAVVSRSIAIEALALILPPPAPVACAPPPPPPLFAPSCDNDGARLNTGQGELVDLSWSPIAGSTLIFALVLVFGVPNPGWMDSIVLCSEWFPFCNTFLEELWPFFSPSIILSPPFICVRSSHATSPPLFSRSIGDTNERDDSCACMLPFMLFPFPMRL